MLKLLEQLDLLENEHRTFLTKVSRLGALDSLSPYFTKEV